jgi:hypothetical protein
MKLVIQNKNKKDLFIAIFQTLKNCSTIISLIFKKDCLFIQGMDKSHVCMFEIKINSTWFYLYENNNNNDKTVYIIAICVLVIICILLLKRILDV